jgi:predicted PurR-regulated permease PerM
MNVTVRIETKTIVRILTTVLLFVFAIFLITKSVAALTLFAIAFFLSIALNPVVSKLAQKLPGKSRVGSAAIAYLIVLLVIGAFLFLVLPPVIQQTSSFINTLPDTIRDLVSKKGVIGDLVDKYHLQGQIDQVIQGFKNQAGGILQGVGAGLLTGVSSIMTGFVGVLTVLVMTFLMLIEGPDWIERIWSLYHNKTKLARNKRLLAGMYKVVTGYVGGQLLVSTIGASCSMLTLLVLHFIFPAIPIGVIIPLGGIIFVMSLIPMFGATIGAIIATIVLVFSSVPAAVIFLVYYVIYQQLENNLVQPIIQSRSVQLTALAVFSSAILGIYLFGILGGILAIPIAGCIRIAINDYIAHKDDYVVTQKRPSILSQVAAKVTGKHHDDHEE